MEDIHQEVGHEEDPQRQWDDAVCIQLGQKHAFQLETGHTEDLPLD